MNRKQFWLAIGAVLLLQGRSHGAELRRIQLLSTEAGPTRVLLDLSAATHPRLSRLEHPARVVIDLPRTRVRRGLPVPGAAGAVSALRLGQHTPEVLRLVLQVTATARPRTQWEPRGPGHGGRLVVTLAGPAQGVAAAASPVAGANAAEHAPAAEGSAVERAIAAAPRDRGPAMSAAAAGPPLPVRAPHAPAEGNRDVVIAVDAGHGGTDPGAIGPNGTREKDVTLAIARALARRIEAEAGMHAVLTRDRDEFVVLRDRIHRARRARADMFVSVHADSIADRGISGASVYVLSERGASSEAARWLAERENSADLMGGVKLDDKDRTLASVLLDLSQTANISASMTAAERVLGSLDGVGQVRKSQVQQAGFVVLKSPDIPSMLIETAYISNPAEEAHLRDTRHQTLLADAIFSGVRLYFTQNPPPGTRFAQARRAAVASLAGTVSAADSALN